MNPGSKLPNVKKDACKHGSKCPTNGSIIGTENIVGKNEGNK